MKCTVCNKDNAVYHYTSTVNGKSYEAHLCSECAKQHGLYANSFFESFDSPFESDGVFGDLFGGILGQHQISSISGKVCDRCGMTYSTLKATGKVGCSKCYEVFKSSLLPTIHKIHGNVVHSGNTPENYKENTNSAKLEALKKELEVCIEKQEYEKAAVIRDRIREMEGGNAK